MSRPANPHDNASCESFIKTTEARRDLRNQYQDLDHLRSNIEEFIERYYKPEAIALSLGLPLARRVRARHAARKRSYNSWCYGKILPAEQGESLYVAGQGRNSDAVPFQTPSLLEN